MWSRATIIAVAVALAGCGTSAAERADSDQIRSVVAQFAGASGPRACALLSPAALVNLYGASGRTVDGARRACLRRSSDFRGAPVTIERLDLAGRGRASVQATGPRGDITYRVALRKFGPAWRIDSIVQGRTH